MKQKLSFVKIVFTLALTAIIFSVFAFRQKSKSVEDSFRQEQQTSDNDTTASGKRNRNGADRDIDKVEVQMNQLELQMKRLDDQMQKLEGQMQNLDMSKYQKEIEEAMKNIDEKEIHEQIEHALDNIDRNEINHSIENIKLNKLKMKEVEKQLQKVATELQKQKYKMQVNTLEIRAEVERAMKNAKESVENAREEIKNVKAFTDALEKDGLIDKSKAYKIEVKDGELFIDGKKQSKEISDKYRKYYKKNDFFINMSEGDDFRI